MQKIINIFQRISSYISAKIEARKDKFYIRHFDMIMTLILTYIGFFVVFGFRLLDPSYIDFVVKGGDFTVSYLGSVFYRLDEWRWPLLTHTNLAYPYGISVHGTDGSPLLSLIFKVFTKVFGMSPEAQFVGIWMLICYTLQAIVSVLIFRHAFKNKFFVIMGALFFVSAPIMMMRCFVHINLMCHFVLLFSILLWMNNRLGRKEWAYMCILFSFGILTCPYFLPMISGFFALLMWQKFFVEKEISFKQLFMGLLSLGLTFGFWFYLLGMVTTEQQLASGGWRDLGLNLSALFNPIFSRSRFFNTLTPKADFDADNYMGLGLLLMVLICFPSIKRLFHSDNLRKNAPLALLLLGLLMFALTSRIRFANTVLLDYNPGPLVDWLGSVFRYSGRFFWPIWYLLAYFAIKTFSNRFAKWSYVLVPLIFFVQVWDLYPTYKLKHDFVTISPKENLPMVSKEWDRLNEVYPNIFIFAHNENYRNMWRWAIAHNKNVNYGFLNRPSKKTLELVDQVREEILSGTISDPSYFYLIDKDMMKRIEDNAKVNPDVEKLKKLIKNIDGFDILEYSEDLAMQNADFIQKEIPVSHRYWTQNLIQISPYRVFRNVDNKFTDYATIVTYNDKELILRWDKYGIEEFEFDSSDKRYHQRVKEEKKADDNKKDEKKADKKENKKENKKAKKK